jgi:hypothetical protein
MLNLIYPFMGFSLEKNAYILQLIPLMLLIFAADIIRSSVAQ